MPFGLQVQISIFSGQLIRGGSVSTRTKTTNLHSSFLPQSSVATQSTTVVPGGTFDPEGGVHTIVTLVSQSSVAVTV